MQISSGLRYWFTCADTHIGNIKKNKWKLISTGEKKINHQSLSLLSAPFCIMTSSKLYHHHPPPSYQHIDDVVRVLGQELDAVVLQLASKIAAHLFHPQYHQNHSICCLHLTPVCFNTTSVEIILHLHFSTFHLAQVVCDGLKKLPIE